MTCPTVEDFAALRAMLLEDEFSYGPDTSDDIKAFWENVASGDVSLLSPTRCTRRLWSSDLFHQTDSTVTPNKLPLVFDVTLPAATLRVVVASCNALPSFAITSDSRATQVSLTHRLSEISKQAVNEGRCLNRFSVKQVY